MDSADEAEDSECLNTMMVNIAIVTPMGTVVAVMRTAFWLLDERAHEGGR